MTNFPRGSEWRKWDLHVHSPFSMLNNHFPKSADGSPDWEPYLKKIETLDISVLGITDYFTIEGYKALQKFKEEGRMANIDQILPNIEFRLKNIVSSKDGKSEKRLNLHVIFSDKVLISDIEEHFLHDLPFFFQGDPQAQAEMRKLKPSNLEILGKKLRAEHEPFREMGNDLEIGAMQAVVDLDDIMKILTTDSRFTGKYLIALAAADWDDINWNTQAHNVRKGLLQQSDLVLASNPQTHSWCLGENPYTDGVEHFIREFKTLKPCIHGSDAHRIEEIGKPCALRSEAAHNCETNPESCQMRYCWIKADSTFEGLKQLLYEPRDRVIIQESNPSPLNSNSTIATATVEGGNINEELSIDDVALELNSSLVAVVGGKGAGKTALVDMIAHCYSDRSTAADRNSFVRRISEYDAPIKIKLSYRDGAEFEKGIHDNEFFEESQLIYIAQGELESYIGESSDLSRHITDLILNSPEIENSLRSHEFESAVHTSEASLVTLQKNNRTIESLEGKTGAEVAGSIDQEKTKVKIDLEDITKRVKEFESTQSKINIEAAQKRQAKFGELKSRKDELAKLEKSLVLTIEAVDRSVEEINILIGASNALMKTTGASDSLTEISYPDRVKLDTILGTVKKDITALVPQIEAEQKALENLERGVKNHAKLLERQQALRDEQRIIDEKKEKFDLSLKNLVELRIEQNKAFRKLYENILSEKNAYDVIIETFSANKAVVLSDIDFFAEVKFDAKELLARAEGVVDNRKVKIEEFLQRFIELNGLVAAGDVSQLDDLCEEANKCIEELRPALKGSPVAIGDLYGLIYGNYMNVIPIVKYKRTLLDKLSLGQKATVLIKIYLAHGDKPIIIDSHDDHLDNEFIMAELVNAIKQAKGFRQVILVSNNGNVVINSDAEQIILASREDGKIRYVAGSIENPEIRDLALNVLEGGREAFKLRQQKYRLVA